MTFMFKRKWNEDKRRYELTLLDADEWTEVPVSRKFGGGHSWVHMTDGAPDRLMDSEDVMFFEHPEGITNSEPTVEPESEESTTELEDIDDD